MLRAMRSAGASGLRSRNAVVSVPCPARDIGEEEAMSWKELFQADSEAMFRLGLAEQTFPEGTKISDRDSDDGWRSAVADDSDQTGIAHFNAGPVSCAA